MEGFLNDLASRLDGFLQAGEHYTAYFHGERSDFVRFNHGRIRQPGTVQQLYVDLRLVNGQRHAVATLTLSGQLVEDAALCRAALADLRRDLVNLPEDPHLLLNTEPQSSRSVRPGNLPPAPELAASIVSQATELDLVGLLATGPIWRGFANSHGQRNWHEVESFSFEWSLYHAADKAVKTGYAGFEWDPATFATKLEGAQAKFALLRREARTLAPGRYRAYLTPTALSEIAGMMCWGGFSGRQFATKNSPLQKMRDNGIRLSPQIVLTESIAEGLAPAFQPEGFARPEAIRLIDAGELTGSMVSPRTAREYGLAANGANDDGETPEALDLAAGNLPTAEVLARLGTGIYIGNLWYTNFSDRSNCRITGMTRFATFWVENGEIVAPCNVMRFDDSVYRMLGDQLEALTVEREFLPDTSTYEQRSTHSMRLPGALLSELNLTL